MEAKGCAKAMTWKDARRRFYWAVRAKVARSAAMAQLAEASPESTHEYREHLLESIAGIEDERDPRKVTEALEKLDLTNTLAQLKADHLARRMLEVANEDKKATIDGLVRLGFRADLNLEKQAKAADLAGGLDGGRDRA